MKAENRLVNGIILGYLIRKQLGKLWIFRGRKGNGFYGTSTNNIYQDKYSYFVPGSINNTEGQRARDILSTAVLNWQSSLAMSDKNEYDRRAAELGGLSGYNLYIREYINTNY